MNLKTYQDLVNQANNNHQRHLYTLAKRYINPVNVNDIVSTRRYNNVLWSIRVERIEKETWGEEVVVGTVVNKDGSPSKTQRYNRMSVSIIERINGDPLKEPKLQVYSQLGYNINL